MLRASASFIAGLALLFALAVAAFAAESHFYPLSGSLARVDLPGAFAFPAQGAGSDAAFSGPGDHETIRVLTDDEIAFMARGTIDPDWDEPRDQSRNADRASFAFAEALGSTLQWLAESVGPAVDRRAAVACLPCLYAAPAARARQLARAKIG